jgi:chemotaxis protein methyltransferase CheR
MIQPADFQFIAQLLKQRSGLALTPDKEYLLETRLQPIARQLGCASLAELVAMLRRSPGDEALLRDVTEAMTTNESMFFRDTKPFEQLRDLVIPRVRQAKASGKMRVWSAACSNGQEPYSISMTLLEQRLAMGGLGWEILATDLDTQVLAKAQEGVYTQFEVQRGTPITLLVKYFSQIGNNQWRIKDEVRGGISYRVHNLIQPCNGFGKFDVVFCRNVLIYFDEETKRGVLNRLADALEPHGVLFLGAAETVLSLTDRFRPVQDQRGVFELRT